MASRASAFAVLGLEPSADRAAVEEAYRRLMKQYHPDRQGGDGARAAEINRAYREIRGGKAPSDPLQFNEALRIARRRSRWPTAALITCAAATGALLMFTVPRSWSPPASLAAAPHIVASEQRRGPLGEDLHIPAIDAAVRDAVRLYRTGDEMRLANESSDCQHRFRANPDSTLLDRCAAFDDAAVELEDRDPLRDGGPFAPLAVTGRQWSAASLLYDDDLAIDGRLDQIRLRVELMLAPVIEPVAPATPPQR